MRRVWNKIKKIWWIFWEVDENDNTEERLSSADKRWLLSWNILTCMGVTALLLTVTGISHTKITLQNGKDVGEAMSMIATYMASATRDEYDDIAKTIRHDLVFSKYGQDIENFIRYIPNTSENCNTCMGGCLAQVFLVCVNTGELYSLDLYDKEELPDKNKEGTILIFGYDEISQTSVHISKSPE
ncbi:MAG: hypothetical protein HFH87_06980 [Lachnospiraceae bacterium]|nr:hypothetical protein [Lachnospiraceae bacterium]